MASTGGITPYNGTILTSIAGISMSNVFVGSFSDVNYNSPTNYTATINWGDGSSTTIGTITLLTDEGNTQAMYEIKSSHTYSTVGTYSIIITVSDTDWSAIISSSAIISYPTLSFEPQILSGPVLNADESVFSFTTDNPLDDLNNYKVFIYFGDGTPNVIGSIIQPGGIGTRFYINLLNSHTYSNSGTYNISCYIQPVNKLSTNSVTCNYCGVVGPLNINLFQINLKRKFYSNILIGSFIDQSNNNLNANNFTGTVLFKIKLNNRSKRYYKKFVCLISQTRNSQYNVYAICNKDFKHLNLDLNEPVKFDLSVINNSGQNPIEYIQKN